MRKYVLLEGVLLMSVTIADSFVSGIPKLLCKGLHSLQACLRGWSLTQSFDESAANNHSLGSP